MNYSESWAFCNPTRLISGEGAIARLSEVAPQGRGLIVTSPGFTSRGITDRLVSILGWERVMYTDTTMPNPTIDYIDQLWNSYRKESIQFVLGLGGGSVLDTAKALSYMLKIKDETFALSAHFKDKVSLPELAPLPMVAIPTTAGTGSEVTPFATIWDLKSHKKYSLSKKDLYPTVAVLDPELTLTLPEEITIIAGLDALSHALESVWNHNANPVSIVFAARAINLVLKNLTLLIDDPRNIEGRAKMLTASLFGGLCISSTRTALAHSMSYPLTAHLGMPHGLACGFTLPALFAFNSDADDGRFDEVARIAEFSGKEALLEEVENLFVRIKVSDLVAQYGVSLTSIQALADEMFTPGRAENNLRDFSLENVMEILDASI